MVDRAQILDLITRYYYNFGKEQGDPTKMTTQGKEYGTFVKVNGQWRYKTRQIAGGSEPPAGWKD